VAWVAHTGGRRESVAVTLAALAAILPAAPHELPSWLTWSIGVLLIWLTVRTIHAQQRLLAELRVAQAELASQAAAAERRRIVREIHDVVAHSLAVTMLHLTGARHVLRRDPERAAEALAEAERLGRQSLADVRRTVGLLESDGRAQAGAAAPLPGAADIQTLVADYRRAGLDVELGVRGDPSDLTAATGLGLYRIVQEALANVAKHAPGASVRVELAIEAGVELRVRDSGRSGGTPIIRSDGGAGLGIHGMRERAILLGGTLHAGPDGDGWAVRCSLPPSALSVAPDPGPRRSEPA
jgi:signal transduction histidine kinase